MTEITMPLRFSRDREPQPAHRWYARTDGGAGYDVCVPGDDEDPHVPSLDLAARVLHDVGEMTEAAIAYVHAAVDARRLGLLDAPTVVSLLVDARDATATLDLNWEFDLYSLWHVTFTDVHDPARRSPIAFGRRVWGAS
jgi:hypothetical protein